MIGFKAIPPLKSALGNIPSQRMPTSLEFSCTCELLRIPALARANTSESWRRAPTPTTSLLPCIEGVELPVSWVWGVSCIQGDNCQLLFADCGQAGGAGAAEKPMRAWMVVSELREGRKEHLGERNRSEKLHKDQSYYQASLSRFLYI